MLELNIFGETASFDHIGLAVNSIREVVDNKLEIFKDETQKVSVAFIKINGIEVELIEPLGENTPITSNLKKGLKLVHLCFRVPDIGNAIKEARKNGFHCIAKPTSVKAFEGKKIAWVFSRTYGLVELLED